MELLFDISVGGGGQGRESQDMLLVQSSGVSTPKSNGNFVFCGISHSVRELYPLPGFLVYGLSYSFPRPPSVSIPQSSLYPRDGSSCSISVFDKASFMLLTIPGAMLRSTDVAADDFCSDFVSNGKMIGLLWISFSDSCGKDGPRLKLMTLHEEPSCELLSF